MYEISDLKSQKSSCCAQLAAQCGAAEFKTEKRRSPSIHTEFVLSESEGSGVLYWV